ncbi:UDP-N-acetylglucosamine 4,6-dehydratase [Arenimonas composti]|uniref:Polysaccharide biosynthesis protein CapD-like domain-containing protein n=1 Tax=Arenimonas composti TR7-09 = DSM 18010 TaxID=1121013 RepID=A0A091C4A1_9GAMM|nr:UDP-N-acetylglucosamine 4,6-dehydratase [Arenimonas composti]KFN51435.1 hypothetical protein P873_02565 [Arenimonas composti TR7-09 = DSM 18010]
MNLLALLGRDGPMFDTDIGRHEEELTAQVRAGRFLVIGGAGSIGQAVTREIFRRRPKVLHVVDISENNTVELVRDLRSTLGYIDGDFRAFAIDCGGREFAALMNSVDGYDVVFNLSALKHVRSEKDPFTLMRLVRVNVLDTLRTLEHAQRAGARRYFSVSTDKAANPVNMMGASKRLMERFLMRASARMPVSTARFANVAFSDGSLLHGFERRLAKGQPISAPNDVRRYFLTPQEAGELCLASALLGDNRDVFFPKFADTIAPARFSDIAVRFLQARGYVPYECADEDEARGRAAELIAQRRWPVYFFASDTTGEKDVEEFYTGDEDLDLARFEAIGVIRARPDHDPARLDAFLQAIEELRRRPRWERGDLVELFKRTLPEFRHQDTGRFLDGRM